MAREDGLICTRTRGSGCHARPPHAPTLCIETVCECSPKHSVRKLALLAALCTRGARVFVRQSSETPGALELGMRRSSSGLRDGVARAIVLMHRSDGGVRRVLPLGVHQLLVCRRSFRTRTRDSRGRLVIGTVGFCRLQ